MRLRNILMGASAAALISQAAFAERGSDGQLNILYWQAVSIMTPYLSSGTKDIEAASLVSSPWRGSTRRATSCPISPPRSPRSRMAGCRRI